jgi:hypothetical protein
MNKWLRCNDRSGSARDRIGSYPASDPLISASPRDGPVAHRNANPRLLPVCGHTCAEVSFGCRKRSIQYAQPNTIGKRMRSTVTRTWTLGGGAPLKLSNQSAVNTTMNAQSTR